MTREQIFVVCYKQFIKIQPRLGIKPKISSFIVRYLDRFTIRPSKIKNVLLLEKNCLLKFYLTEIIRNIVLNSCVQWFIYDNRYISLEIRGKEIDKFIHEYPPKTTGLQ